jgi:hypothetical protein
MTSGQGPYGNPTGESGAAGQPDPQSWGPPEGQPPYGQPAYGEPSQGQPPYGQPPYGQPPYGQPPYGQPPYGQQLPYPGYGAAPSAPTGYGAPAPVERPLSVRAGIGAFVGSIVLSLVAHLITLLNLDTLFDVATETELGDLSAEEADMVAAMGDTFGTFGLLLGVIFTGIFALFVWFAWRGHNWARIVLWVLAGLGIVFGIIGAGLSASLGGATLPVLEFLSWVEMLFDAVAIVLLALKPSSEWYRYRGWLRATGQPG